MATLIELNRYLRLIINLHFILISSMSQLKERTSRNNIKVMMLIVDM